MHNPILRAFISIKSLIPCQYLELIYFEDSEGHLGPYEKEKYPLIPQNEYVAILSLVAFPQGKLRSFSSISDQCKKGNSRLLTTVGYRVQVEIDSFGLKHCHGLRLRTPGGQVKIDEVPSQVPFTVSLLSSHSIWEAFPQCLVYNWHEHTWLLEELHH